MKHRPYTILGDSIQEWLKRELDANGLTYKAAVDHLRAEGHTIGAHPANVGNWITGYTPMPLDYLPSMCRLFGYSETAIARIVVFAISEAFPPLTPHITEAA